MGRLPVGKTIAETYRFAFGNYLSSLGVIWLPYLVIALLAYWMLMPALSASVDVLREVAQQAQHPTTPPRLPGGFGKMMGGILLFELLVLLIFPVIAIGISKEVLGLRRGPRFIYLGIGRPELLFFAGVITILVLYFVAVFAVALVGGIIGGIFIVASANQDPATAVAKMTAAIRILTAILYVPLVYFAVRMGYLLAPISAAESRFGVWRGWRLMRGNFWRAFAVLLATMLPLTLLFYAVWFLVSGPDFFQYTWDSFAHAPLPPDEIAAQMKLLLRAMPIIWIAGFVLAPVSYGLLFSQVAYAYRALSPADPSASS